MPIPEIRSQPSLEAQIADHADEIAYTNHDLDDGLRSELLTLPELDEVSFWRETRAEVVALLGDPGERVLRAQTIRALIDCLVMDLTETTARRIEASGVGSVEAVRASEGRLVGYSPEIAPKLAALKAFLSKRLYHHPRVLAMTAPAVDVIGDLVRHYRKDSRALPPHVVSRFDLEGEARAIADYVAGMTDRFAFAEHGRLRAV